VGKKRSSKLFKIIKPDEMRTKKKYNDWGMEEDILLLKLSKKYSKKWNKISRIIGNKKTPRMCKYRLKKLSKFVYINKYNEVVERRTRQEFVDEDMCTLTPMSSKKEKRRSRILLRHPSKRSSRGDVNMNNENPQTPLAVIAEKADSNVSMINESTINFNYERALNDLDQLHLQEDSNKLFQIPFSIKRKVSKESNNDCGMKPISDLTIRSMNSGEVSFAMINQMKDRTKSPLVSQDVLLNSNHNGFKSAFKSVFKVKQSSENNTDKDKDKPATSHVYFNQFDAEKVDTKEPPKQQDLSNVNTLVSFIDDVLGNSNFNSEEKNIILTNNLINIRNLSKEASQNDLKLLTMYQAKILEFMINQTRNLFEDKK